MASGPSGIQPSSVTDSPLYNVRYAKREVTVHSVTDSELDTVASLSNSIHLAFLGMCSGAFLTLFTTVFTVEIANSKTFAAFIAATIVMFIGTMWFGIRARIEYKKAERKLQEIKQPMTQSLQ